MAEQTQSNTEGFPLHRMQRTSLDTFEAIQGHLTGRRREVYNAISFMCNDFDEGCYPSDEDIIVFLDLKANNVSPRRCELVDHRAITCAGKKKNEAGHLVNTWKITNEFWEYEKQETKAEYWKKLYTIEQNKVKELQKQLEDYPRPSGQGKFF